MFLFSTYFSFPFFFPREIIEHEKDRRRCRRCHRRRINETRYILFGRFPFSHGKYFPKIFSCKIARFLIAFLKGVTVIRRRIHCQYNKCRSLRSIRRCRGIEGRRVDRLVGRGRVGVIFRWWHKEGFLFFIQYLWEALSRNLNPSHETRITRKNAYIQAYIYIYISTYVHY